MVRARPPKKLRKICRLIFRLIEKHEKVVFPRKPRNPRGIIAFVFEGSKVFVLNAGDVSPFTYTDFLEYQSLRSPRGETWENQKISYIS